MKKIVVTSDVVAAIALHSSNLFVSAAGTCEPAGYAWTVANANVVASSPILISLMLLHWVG